MSRRLTGGRQGDVLLVIAVLILGVAHTRGGGDYGASTPTYVLDVLLPLPLLARRSRPLAAFAALSALALAEWVIGTPADGNVAVLLGLYSVGAHSTSRRDIVLAAATAQLGVVLAALRWAPAGQTLTALLLLTGTVTAAWALGISVRTRRSYLASLLERARTAERERDQHVMLAAAQERTRIARELHDIVAHSVAVMIALSDGAAATADRDPLAAKQASEQASATGRQALTEMHRLLGVLRENPDADLAPQPGLADIPALLAPVRAAGVDVRLSETGSSAALSPVAQLAVYRVVQESLTNTLKHGQAVTRVGIRLRYDSASVDIVVEDNGRRTRHPATRGNLPAAAGPLRGALTSQGREPAVADPSDDIATGSNAVPPRGHGLIGMRERLAAFDGQLNAGPTDDGWRLHAQLPVAPPALDSGPHMPVAKVTTG